MAQPPREQTRRDGFEHLPLSSPPSLSKFQSHRAHRRLQARPGPNGPAAPPLPDIHGETSRSREKAPSSHPCLQLIGTSRPLRSAGTRQGPPTAQVGGESQVAPCAETGCRPWNFTSRKLRRTCTRAAWQPTSDSHLPLASPAPGEAKPPASDDREVDALEARLTTAPCPARPHLRSRGSASARRRPAPQKVTARQGGSRRAQWSTLGQVTLPRAKPSCPPPSPSGVSPVSSAPTLRSLAQGRPADLGSAAH